MALEMFESALAQGVTIAEWSVKGFEAAQAAQVPFDPGEVFLDREFHEAMHAVDAGRTRGILTAEKADVNIAILEMQSGPAIDRQAGAFAHHHALGQIAAGPGAQAEAFPLRGDALPGGGVHSRLDFGLGEIATELVEVATTGERLLVVTDNLDARAQVGRHRIRRPRGRRHRDTVTLLKKAPEV